jgi:hypothetical protein
MSTDPIESPLVQKRFVTKASESKPRSKRSRDVEESEEPATDKRKDKSKPIDWRKVSTKTKIWFRKKDGSYHQEMIGNEYSSKAASSKREVWVRKGRFVFCSLCEGRPGKDCPRIDLSSSKNMYSKFSHNLYQGHAARLIADLQPPTDMECVPWPENFDTYIDALEAHKTAEGKLP